ncbi:MAG TPA: hypothetical protein VNO21_09720 [Polyangiaceae bacterium]|nr:hypothetical protein [Polyangiaceae bacterium]
MKGGSRLLTLAAVIGVTGIATWQRARAIDSLQPDYDEMPYLNAAYRRCSRSS